MKVVGIVSKTESGKADLFQKLRMIGFYEVEADPANTVVVATSSKYFTTMFDADFDFYEGSKVMDIVRCESEEDFLNRATKIFGV